ncbi:MAG TPA: hypothetical protein VMS79_05535 [Methanomassiliicoccales archaeon]|jgi:hypothetical protein|nr:hypothetical protein [Methanomassiliicoccales archaeon]
MATSKRNAEEGREAEEAPSEPEGPSHGIPKEAQAHLIRAGSEFALAMEGIFREVGLPEEARKHAIGMRKEGLLMLKAMIDADLKRCDRAETSRPSKRIRQIKVD